MNEYDFNCKQTAVFQKTPTDSAVCSSGHPHRMKPLAPGISRQSAAGKEGIDMKYSDAKSVYFIGIGGISMSSLALMTQTAGKEVRGYDRTPSQMTQKLENAGITVYYHYAPTNMEGCDLAVYTAAIKEDDPELLRAGELGIPAIPRAEYMGDLMLAYNTRIGVAGSHGKSTTTSMLASICITAGLDPTVVVGAELSSIGGAYRLGGRDQFIFEACEYTDSFLSFFPTTAVAVNLEMDHTDYFHSLDQIIDSFSRYLRKADTAVINGDDANLQRAAEGHPHVVTFGLGEGCDYTAQNIFGALPGFDLAYHGKVLTHIQLSIPGRHNILNALAAAAAAVENGVDVNQINPGLLDFRGAKRRFELRGELVGASIYDDYAHHPTEIRACIAAARGVCDERGGRLLVVYQPHTYSRTYSLYDKFTKAFAGADEVIFTDIYAAREKNEWNVSSAQLAADVVGTKGRYIADFKAIEEAVRADLKAGDVLLIMGAGDIIKLSNMLLTE